MAESKKKATKKPATKAKVAKKTAKKVAKPAKTTVKKTKESKKAEKKTEKIEEIQTIEVAKAGKRSSKSLKEAGEKVAKEERKTKAVVADEEPKKPKQTIKPTRPKHERSSKNYREAYKLIDRTKQYDLKQALELIGKTCKVKFDATVELHIRLGVDPRQADQNIRDSIMLPAGTGKKVKIAVFAEEDDAKKAKTAGADIVGIEPLIAMFDKETTDFDVLIATPSTMAQLSKYARILGPKGLMPSPKSNTVAADVAKAVKEAKSGRVEYRVDTNGIVHVAIGKVSFTPKQLQDNAQAILSSIKSAKPSSLKGVYFRSIFVTTTMGPSISIVTSES